ncbi:putative exosome complex exonuclease 1 [Tetrabaena socialis]|uniref:Putative exosome complex exonuclease 1 n=1 Tax=Tetrabaena socialis TaxID=47790 RepID=A0A2J8A6W1_9CHLO|nr:putative exosome complex exonuclease 1 [Tetrabaena socialis]|eukprot:PNH08272.1 putative exosome complex exonuclease 1 [Tetrabaena socialis]
MEFVSPEGLRLDGRRPRELRRINCQLDVLSNADGSAIFEMGNTKVLQADGGTRCAAINAAVLALAAAGVPLRDLLASCAAGHLEGTPLLDLNYIEDSGGGPDLAVALAPRLGQLVLVQMDARLAVETFQTVLELARDGCHAISEVMRRALLEHTKRLAVARGLAGST